jgi:hypothetical protein
MTETISKIRVSVRRTGFLLAAAALGGVLILYYFGEFREASKYLLVAAGIAGVVASLFFTSKR